MPIKVAVCFMIPVARFLRSSEFAVSVIDLQLIECIFGKDCRFTLEIRMFLVVPNFLVNQTDNLDFYGLALHSILLFDTHWPIDRLLNARFLFC